MSSTLFRLMRLITLKLHKIPITRLLRNSSKNTCDRGNKTSNNKNLSVVLKKANEIKLEERPVPVPNDNQVLLQMEVVGICGYDVHYWLKGKVGPFNLKNPIVLGHESSGSILKCGSNVKSLQPGDRVAIEPGVPCRTCEFCKTGRYHLCPFIAFCATPPVDGNLCRFFCIDADFCHRLPDHVTLEEGALCEPLAVGIHANRLAKINLGSVCLVQGSGPVGMCTGMVAKAFGASKVLITDIDDRRLKMAKEIGAADLVLNTSKMKEMEVAVKIIEILNEEPHATFECAGTVVCARMGLHVTKAGGFVVLLGMGADEMSLPFSASLVKEITIIGSFRYANDYRDAVELLRARKVNIKPIGTHHFKLEDSVKAFETYRDKTGCPIKILVHCNPKWKPNKC
ncbi:unnamed protein product [Diabrotica balteata]|uniref:Sorbitol dehydrogenase n=1 Tax=Diabrotica balteata TaxID=107213 RepID=A0A9N9TE18_DIABA|nr:unnamed protein product [Diabrotica balteata]